MRKLIYHIASTLDGFIARPDGNTGGFLHEGDHVSDYLQSLKDYDTVIMGRKTYEHGYQYGLQPGEPPYTHMMHYIFSKKLVFENTHEQVAIVRENEAEFVKKLKQSIGSPIYLCGGGQLAGLMLHHQLVDQLVLKLNPVLFGAGIGLYGDHCVNHKLEPLHHIAYDNGVHLLRYNVKYD